MGEELELEEWEKTIEVEEGKEPIAQTGHGESQPCIKKLRGCLGGQEVVQFSWDVTCMKVKDKAGKIDWGQIRKGLECQIKPLDFIL